MNAIRLYVLVEGQTEEAFVKRTLGPHLEPKRTFTHPIVVTTSRDQRTGRKIGRGGGRWAQWSRHLSRLMREQSGVEARFTTLFDLYGLPGDFPRLAEHKRVADTERRATLLEHAMAESAGDWRFVPYLQRHEFEALVLAGPQYLEMLLDTKEDIRGVQALRISLKDLPPEDVDDSPENAPSKRLAKYVPSYQKVAHGPLVVDEIGVPALRAVCPRFDAWIARLEQLSGSPDRGGAQAL